MNNLITARLRIMHQAAVTNQRHVNSLVLKPAPTPEEQLLQGSMQNALQDIPTLIVYLIACCTDDDVSLAKTRVMQKTISRIEYDFGYARAYITSFPSVDMDKILTLDTQIVYTLAKDGYQELKDIPEINSILTLLRNFPTVGGDT